MTATKRDGKWHIGIEDTFESYMNSFSLLPGDYGNEKGAKAAAKAKTEEIRRQSKGKIWDQVYIVRPDGSKYLYVHKIPVFLWKENRGWVGDGFCPMVACFTARGVHVHFTVFRGQHGEYLTDELEKIVSCNGACRHAQGHTEDFSEKRRDDQYMVKPIVDAALAFRK